MSVERLVLGIIARVSVERLVLGVVSVSLVGAASVASPAQGAGSVPFEWLWEIGIEGLNKSSSPVIADIDSDGRNEVVFGHRDGILRAYEADGSLKWATSAVPGTGAHRCRQQSAPSAIDSSPAVADIDDDGQFEVVVGVGSAAAAARDQNGSVIAFDGSTGRIEWSFAHSRDTGNVWDGHVPGQDVPDGWCEATFSTPAIGDVDGDGAADVVFGSYDFYIWAVDGSGDPLPGFPINNDDSIWASPALFDVDDDGDVEIFIGGDSTPGGYIDHLGGLFRAFDYRDSGPSPMWTRYANEVFHSSAAIADINGDGRFEAVTGTGDFWSIQCRKLMNPACGPDDGTDNTKVWAFHLDDGTDLPGWPVSAGDTVWSSPSIGDIDADGGLEVVVGADDERVYAFNGDGSMQWAARPQFAHFGSVGIVRGSAVIADLDGDADQDVAIGTSRGLALLDGRTGAELEANLFWRERMSFSTSHDTVPAVGDLDGRRSIVFIANSPDLTGTRLAAYKLPSTPARDHWPMFRHGPTRTGAAASSRAGHAALSGEANSASAPFYADPIAWLIDTDVVDSGSALCAAPTYPATRGETALLLWRVEGSPASGSHPFNDVVGAELNRSVSWMYSNGMTTGKSVSTGRFFAPDDKLTRAEIAAFLHRYADSPPAPDHPFVDVVSGWQQEPVAWLFASGITTGTSESHFSPDSTVTRGEFATFLYRFEDRPRVETALGSPLCSPVVSSTAPPEWADVSLGEKHTCGLRSDGSVRCWGANASGQSEDPVGQFTAISVAENYSCGIRVNNRVHCWGGLIPELPAGMYKAISAGSFLCGIRLDDTIACSATARAPSGEFRSLSVGDGHMCGVRINREVVCRAENITADPSPFKQLEPPDGEFTAVSAGTWFSCGIRLNRAIECWGYRDRGLNLVPSGEFTEVSAGNWYACGLRSTGGIECWGYNSHGQTDHPAGRFRTVSTSFYHSCAVSSTIECWGDVGY